MNVKVTIPRAKLAAIRKRVGDTNPALSEIGYYIARRWMPEEFKTSGHGTWPPVRRGGQPLWDTGTLAKSFYWAVLPNGKTVRVGTFMKYAGLQNFGGTITAKKGKFLAIPLPSLTVSERRTMGPRDFKDTFFAKSKAGNLILFQTVKKARKARRGVTALAEGDIRPIFVMKKSVTIPPRPFAVWRSQLKAAVRQIFVRRMAVKVAA